MIAVTLVVTALACFVVGWLIADGLNEKRFWDRQNFMEKINRRF